MTLLPPENLSEWRGGSGIEENRKSVREGEKEIERR
jgi:hypothetical protein